MVVHLEHVEPGITFLLCVLNHAFIYIWGDIPREEELFDLACDFSNQFLCQALEVTLMSPEWHKLDYVPTYFLSCLTMH